MSGTDGVDENTDTYDYAEAFAQMDAVKGLDKTNDGWADGINSGEITSCPACKANQKHFKIDDNRGELICDNCGMVLEQNLIDLSAPTRRFSKDDPSVDNSHHGAPPSILFPDKGLTTTFNAWEGGPRTNRLQNYILKRTNQQTVTNKERNLAVALGDLARIVSRMGLSKPVHQEAARIYREAVDAKLIRGRSIEGVVAASLYASCRMCGLPRSLDEIADGTRTGRKEIARNWTTLRKRITRLKRAPPPRPEAFLERYANVLNLHIRTSQRATELLSSCFDGGVDQGKNPIGIVAACLYIACTECDERRTQREIAKALCITEVTIRNRYKEALEVLKRNANN
jgi:transcription initiation factor TFIIB